MEADSDPRQKAPPPSATPPASTARHEGLPPPRSRVRFALGRVVITPGALAAIPEPEVWMALRRHSHGDWGNVNEEDQKENELSLQEGFRVLSVYESQTGTKFWVITEADRSSTCILLPHEY